MYNIDEIKRLSNLNEIVRQAGIPLKNHRACCPFHHEKTASFFVHPSGKYYKCFGCGASGDAIKFIEQYYNTDFKGAIAMLANMTNIPEMSKDQSTVFTHKRNNEKRYRDYIKHISLKLCEAFRQQRAIILSENIIDLELVSKTYTEAVNIVDFTDYLIDLIASDDKLFYKNYRKEAEKIVERYT